MSYIQITDLAQDVLQVCRQCPISTFQNAYIRAARQFCADSRWLRSTLLGSTTAPFSYSTGTVAVTITSAAVVGTGTVWLANIQAGDTFNGPDGTAYRVLSVTDNTHLTLTSAYAGATLSGQAYSLTRVTATYNLGSDTYSEVVGIAAASIQESVNDSHPLTNRASDEWDKDDDVDVPELYAYLPNAQIALHPTPDAVYALTITLVLQPKFSASAIDDSLLVKWREALNNGTLGYLLALTGPGIPWTDKKEAGTRMAMFQAAINEARSDALAGYNAGALSSGIVGARSASVRTRMQAI